MLEEKKSDCEIFYDYNNPSATVSAIEIVNQEKIGMNWNSVLPTKPLPSYHRQALFSPEAIGS